MKIRTAFFYKKGYYYYFAYWNAEIKLYKKELSKKKNIYIYVYLTHIINTI